jgi:hypothetical protein
MKPVVNVRELLPSAGSERLERAYSTAVRRVLAKLGYALMAQIILHRRPVELLEKLSGISLAARTDEPNTIT